MHAVPFGGSARDVGGSSTGGAGHLTGATGAGTTTGGADGVELTPEPHPTTTHKTATLTVVRRTGSDEAYRAPQTQNADFEAVHR